MARATFKATIIAVCFMVLSGCSPSWSPQLSAVDNYTMNFQLGDEIIPFPLMKGRFDCDDAVIYSYIYLNGLYKEYDVKIMYGRSYFMPGYKRHVWLDVSDNGTRYIYDWGLPVKEYSAYKGKEIRYVDLLRYAVLDAVNSRY